MATEASSKGLRLVIRRANSGDEVSIVPVYTNEPEFVAKVAADIRASLRDGYYLEVPGEKVAAGSRKLALG